jgi:hypothetical protein
MRTPSSRSGPGLHFSRLAGPATLVLVASVLVVAAVLLPAVPSPLTAPATNLSGVAALGRSTSPVAAAVAPHPGAGSGFTWTNITGYTGLTPGCRDSEGIAYDAALKEVVLFGGVSQCGTPQAYSQNDTWVFANDTWTNISARLSTSPSPRWGMAFVYDPATEQIVLFGGSDASGDVNGETWVFNGTWTDLTSRQSVSPPALYSPGATYDPNLGGVLLYGGQNGFASTPIVIYNQTWEFNGLKWSLLNASGPAGLRAPALAFDTAENESILFGGTPIAGPVSNETWAFTKDNWSELFPTTEPAARYTPGVAYDPASSSLYLFGGASASGSLLNDTWNFSGGQWSSVSPSNGFAPSPREGFRMVWDPASDYGLGFGGQYAGLRYNGTYVFPSVPPTLAELTAAPAALDVGHETVLTTKVELGVGPYSYAYTGLPGGCVSADETPLDCAPTVNGSFAVRVTVTPSAGAIANATVDLVVYATLNATSLAASPAVVDANTTTALETTVVGGTPPLDYAYSDLPPGCVSLSAPALACRPVTPGTYTVEVTVIDSFGERSVATAHLTVLDPFTLLHLAVAPATVDLGQSVLFTASVGGDASTISFVYSGLPAGCVTNDSATLSCTATVSGGSTVKVTGTDGAGVTLNATATFVVNPDPRVLAFTASESSVRTGSPIDLTVSATGGTGLYTYVYLGLPNDCPSENATTLTCASSDPGTYDVTVHVTDARGVTAADSVTITFTTPSGTTSSSSGLSLWEWALIAAAAVAALVVAFVLWSRRKGPEEPSSPPAAPTPKDPPNGGSGPADGLRLSQRVLVHLSTQGTLDAYETAPASITQAGIATALGVRQSNVANSLGRLVSSGQVAEGMRHVRGQARRLKVYQLTPQGQMQARELRGRPPPGPAE